MVSDAAKKRRQNKKKEKKRLNNEVLFQKSKSQTNLSQFLDNLDTNNNNNDIEEDEDNNNNNNNDSKEIGDEELEELLAGDDGLLELSNDTTTNEATPAINSNDKSSTPISNSHSKNSSMSKYTFFKDDDDDEKIDNKNTGNGNDDEEEPDLFGADEDLDFLDDEEEEEDHNDIATLSESNHVRDTIDSKVEETDILDQHEDVSVHHSVEEVIPELVQEKVVPELVQHEEIIPEVVQEETVPELLQEEEQEEKQEKEEETIPELLQEEEETVPELLQQDEIIPESVQEEQIIPELVQHEQAIVSEPVQEEETIPEAVHKEEIIPEIEQNEEIVTEPVLEQETIAEPAQEEHIEATSFEQTIPKEADEIENNDKTIPTADEVESANFWDNIPSNSENIVQEHVKEKHDNIEDDESFFNELSQNENIQEPVISPQNENVDTESVPEGDDEIEEHIEEDLNHNEESNENVNEHIDDESFFNNFSKTDNDKESIELASSDVPADNELNSSNVEQPDLVEDNDHSFFNNLSKQEPETKEEAEEEKPISKTIEVDEDESILESDEHSLLDSDEDIELPETTNFNTKEDQTEANDTVIKSSLEEQTTLHKEPVENTIEEEDEFSFLEDDDDLLEDDDDSLLDSDEDLLLDDGDDENNENNAPSEEIKPADTEKKINRYAPTTQAPAKEFTPTSHLTHNDKPNMITPQIISSTRPTIISPQIVKFTDSTVSNNQPDPQLKQYKNLKQKTDAYDFPVDLVSNLKPPAKAKPIQTLANKKIYSGAPSTNSVPVPSNQQVPTQPQLPINSNVPAVPVNPYAAPKHTKTASVAKNIYAPPTAPVSSSMSPKPSVGSTVGIIKPGLNIVSQPDTAPPPSMAPNALPGLNNQPPVSNKPTRKAPIPSSNTDLPFNIAPPKAVPRVKNNTNTQQQSTPPIPMSVRARAVSNVSASSLSNNANSKHYSPTIQSNSIFENPPSQPGSNGPALSQVLGNQNHKSRTGSFNSNKPWGGASAGDNPSIPNGNPYGSNFQHIRKNSSVSYSPINTNFGNQQQQLPILSPTIAGLQSTGLNNLPINPLNNVSPNPSAHKISHARSQSSVYAPNKSNGASAKYAPIVHPSIQQAYSQQQDFQQNNQFNQQQPQQFQQGEHQMGHSRTASAYIPQQQSINNQYAPPLQQNFNGQNSYVPPSIPEHQPPQSVFTPASQVNNNFIPVNPMQQQQQQQQQQNQQTKIPGINNNLNNTMQHKFTSESIQHQTSVPYSNPEQLLSRQFPIFQWASNGKILSMKPSQYSGVTNIKISSVKSYVDIPKYFIDFPGPLIRGKTKSKTVSAWLSNTVELINGDSAYDSNGKILWQLIAKKIELMDDKKMLPKLHEFSAKLFDPTDLLAFIQNSSYNLSQNSGMMTQQQMTGFKLDFEGLAQVLTYLRVGDHSTALDIALKNNDFSMAMVISSLMGKEKWTEVVDLYLKKEFQGSGPDSEFAVSLLSSIFQVFIGNGKSLVSDFSSNPSKTQWAIQNWNIVLAAILANGKSSTDSAATNSLLVGFLVDFGIFLYNKKELLAANCCFILADIPLSENELLPESNVVFKSIGASNSLDSILLSELYEFSFNANGAKFNGFISLIPSKITRSEVLLLQDEYSLASKCLDACSQVNKELPKTSALHIKYSYIIDKLKTQATDHNESWIGKPTLSGVWGTLDKSFNKLIGGDDISGLNEPIPKTTSKLFDNYGVTLSRNSSQLDLSNTSNFISAPAMGAPRLPQGQQIYGTPAGSSLLSEQAQTFQNNTNPLTKSAIGHLRAENAAFSPGPPSSTSVASSEQFNQQVAGNLAKLHSHSRDQSVESILSFASNQQKSAKRSSTSSYIPQQQQQQLQNSIYGNTELHKNVSSPSVKHYEINGMESLDQELSTIKAESVAKRTVKKYSLEQFEGQADAVTKSPSVASNKYSPERQQLPSPTKYAPPTTQQNQFKVEEKQDQNDLYHEQGLFDQTNVDDVDEAANPVNSPPKKVVDQQSKHPSVSQIDSPSNFSFPPSAKGNSQTTLNAYAPISTKNTDELTPRKDSDYSPHTSQLTMNQPFVALPEPQNTTYKTPSINNHLNSNSSFNSPVKSDFMNTNNNSPMIQSDFQPPSKPFGNIVNTKSPSYTPVTPKQQQSGWARSHSRSSSQILAEITGSHNNNNSNNTSGFNNPNGGLGGSNYTSRNVSTDSMFASSEPVIRQVRSSSVVFTPDSKRKPTEKLYYDDIVEEETEEDALKASKAEAAAVEAKLAKAREEAERQRKAEEQKQQQQQEDADKKKEDEEKKKKSDGKDTPGWFGWLKANPNEKKPIKAKLGQKNQFYYDEKLKRWVNKNASEDEKNEMEKSANTPPPPPPVIKKKSVQPESKPRSGSVMGGPTQRTMGVLPPRNPITGEPLIPETEPDHASFNKSRNTPVVQSVAEEGSSGMGNSNDVPISSGRIMNSNVNLTSSTTGLDDLLSLGGPPPGLSNGPPGSRTATPPTLGRVGSGPVSGSSRRNKRSNRGYVNVMENL